MDFNIDFSEIIIDETPVSVTAANPLTIYERLVGVKRRGLTLFDRAMPHKVSKECFNSKRRCDGADR